MDRPSLSSHLPVLPQSLLLARPCPDFLGAAQGSPSPQVSLHLTGHRSDCGLPLPETLLMCPPASASSPCPSFKRLCDLGPSTPLPSFPCIRPLFTSFYTAPPSICLTRLLSTIQNPAHLSLVLNLLPDPASGTWQPPSYHSQSIPILYIYASVFCLV